MKALALGFLLFATSPIVIDTTKLADGAREVRREGSRTVSVARDGDTVVIRVDEGKRVDTVTITRNPDGQLSIGHRDNGEPRQLIALDRRPVIVDGIDLEPFLASNAVPPPPNSIAPLPPQPEPERGYRGAPRYYVCPKDETMVRVPAGRTPGELKCPLDGTPMRAGTGRDSQIFLLD